MIKFKPIEIPQFKQKIAVLPKFGLIKTIDYFSYLDIDDRFVHYAYTLFVDLEIHKPDYFTQTKNNIGAHITLFYPEEKILLNKDLINKKLNFDVEGLYIATLLDKTYYLIKTVVHGLPFIRSSYGLSTQLQFKNHLVEPHITVAVKRN